jgi:Predicted pyridoxal phosphate-dependent enzyme apparently involved in regulation of cell wall biogenesis
MILLNDFKRQWHDTREAVLAAVSAVGESGWYILGDEVREFETALARHWTAGHAVGVASGLDAIEISLKVLGCKTGDRVLTTPLSAFATTLAIVKLGASPVFVDTDEFGLIDLRACRRILERRRDIRFLVPVHLYGHALNLHELRALREDFGCLIVEDCAQSISATFDGLATGSTGQMAATSFYPTKNLGAMGDGGAVLTSDAQYAAAARSLRDYGQRAKYRHDWVGYNSKLDELQAAILRRAYLPKLAQWTERRWQIASAYLDGICHANVRPLGRPEGSNSVWHLFPVLVDPRRKAEFMSYLKTNGIACGEHYPVPIQDQEALAYVEHEMADDCSAARCIAKSEVSLPIHPYLTDEEVARVIEISNAWV